MKKSHRKDVVIARITFAIACVLLILLITGGVMLVKHLAPKGEKQPDSEVSTETQSDTEPDAGDTQQVPETPDTQEVPVVDTKPVMKTTTGVNMRQEPNTDCEVIMVLEPGTQLELLGEENGWAFVEYQGQTGYVSTAYLEDMGIQ